MKKKQVRKTRRNRSDHPNLKKKYTLLRRQEFLDTEYVNGVFDKDGKMVIRALNYSEKNWLNKFYKETLNASVNKKDSFYPIKGIDHLTPQDLKQLKNPFLTTGKNRRVDEEKLKDKKLIASVAEEFKVTRKTVINLLRIKEITDANNSLNSDVMKHDLRSTCEIVYDGDNEDFFYPDQEYETIEDYLIDYLDYENRKNKGWEPIED